MEGYDAAQDVRYAKAVVAGGAHAVQNENRHVSGVWITGAHTRSV